MTLVRNQRGGWEAEFRSAHTPRLHIALRTTRRAEADRRHVAVGRLYEQAAAYPDLLDLLRARRLSVAAIEACVRDGRSFDTLRARSQWPTVAQAVEQYLTALAARPATAANTRAQARSNLTAFLAWTHDGRGVGTYRVDALPTAAVDAYAADLRARGRAESTVSGHLIRIGAVWTWLRRREEREAREQGRAARLLHAPVDPDTLPKALPSRERFLTVAECTAVLDATPPALRCAVLLGLHAGLRRGEVTALRWADVAADGAAVIVRKPKGHTQGKRPRVVPTTPALAHALCEARASAPAGSVYVVEFYLRRQDDGTTDAARAYALDTRPGQRLHDETLSLHVKAIVERAGLPWGRGKDSITYHTLRHTFASHLAMAGVDLYTISKLLGNTLAVVERTYAHLAADHLALAVQRVGTLGTRPALPAGGNTDA